MVLINFAFEAAIVAQVRLAVALDVVARQHLPDARYGKIDVVAP